MNTTIFPVPLGTKIHAAFIADYRTDTWYTMCGRDIPEPSLVEHKAGTEVSCPACDKALERPRGRG